MWYGLRDHSKSSINKIYITASGGPFLNISQNKLNNVRAKDAVNHPIGKWEKNFCRFCNYDEQNL